jgi:GAF domain-containing protein
MTDTWKRQVQNADRLAAVEHSGLTGLFADDAFDRLLELAIAVTGAPRGVISLVDTKYTTAISGYGFPDGLALFAPVDLSFCRFVVGYGRPFLVEDALNDPRTIGDPAIDAFKAVAWIGFPIEDSEGNVLGTFCLMDSSPRAWSALDIQTVATLAQAASTEVALREEQTGSRVARARLTEFEVKSLPWREPLEVVIPEPEL